MNMRVKASRCSDQQSMACYQLSFRWNEIWRGTGDVGCMMSLEPKASQFNINKLSWTDHSPHISLPCRSTTPQTPKTFRQSHHEPNIRVYRRNKRLLGTYHDMPGRVFPDAFHCPSVNLYTVYAAQERDNCKSRNDKRRNTLAHRFQRLIRRYGLSLLVH
jgi:hypothetical protein